MKGVFGLTRLDNIYCKKTFSINPSKRNELLEAAVDVNEFKQVLIQSDENYRRYPHKKFSTD